MKQKQTSFVFKLTVVTLLILVISTGSIAFFGYTLNRGETIEYSAEKVLSIAVTLAAAIDGDQVKSMMESGEKTEYWYTVKDFLDKTYVQNDLLYLYVLDKEYGNEVTYFAEGFDSQEDSVDLGETDTADNYADEMFQTIDTGEKSTTDIYKSGDYGNMVSGFAPILDKNGAVVGVVGVDLGIDQVLESTRQYGLLTALFVVIWCVILGIVLTRYLVRSIGRPVLQLAEAGKRIAVGDIDIKFETHRNDEIGSLTNAFRDIIESSLKQEKAFGAMAEGDFSVQIAKRSDKDILNAAIAQMIQNLNIMFSKINQSASQVSAGSRQIAQSSQSLASGSSEQSNAIEQLSGSVNLISAKTQNNTKLSHQAEELNDAIKKNAETGNDRMHRMLQAVNEISQASSSIGKVIKVIDDIAFQTNILALNAAVEAARAGQHGKGFAVVAEEVRNLAAKSAEAAKDTGTLIQNSMEKAEMGTGIAKETAKSFEEIVSGINDNVLIVKDIARISEEQNKEIDAIQKGIDAVTQVVTQNSAASEESAAASEEMSGQAELLNELVSQFALQEAPDIGMLPPPSVR